MQSHFTPTHVMIRNEPTFGVLRILQIIYHWRECYRLLSLRICVKWSRFDLHEPNYTSIQLQHGIFVQNVTR